MGNPPSLLKGVWEVGPPTRTYLLRPPRGKAITHVGRDARTGEPVAVVLLRPPWNRNRGVRDDYLHGVAQLRRLDHPHVVKVLDVVAEDDVFALVTEPLLGDNLHRHVTYRAVTVSEAEVVRIMRQVTSGLEHAHGRGVVFGNVKPTNIELAPDGTAKLFALPKRPHQFVSFLEAAAYLGYPLYNAPEVLRCEPVTERTDVYGLGITAYEMIVSTVTQALTGNLATDFSRVASQAWPEPAEGVEEIDPLLNQVVARCLRLDPAGRYGSAAEVLADLDRVKGKSSPLISPQRLLEIVGTAFPAPLASLAKALERDDHLVAQKDKLLNQAGGLANYLGFLAAASLGGPLPDTFARPSLGHWVGLVRQAFAADGVGWPFTELKARPDFGELLKGLDEVVRLRNSVAHAANPEEGAVLHEWVGRMGAEVRRLYKGLLFLPNYSLVAVEDLDFRDGRFVLGVRRLDGAGEPGPVVPVEAAEPRTRGRVYFAAADLGRMTSLHPWVVLARCPLCQQRELFFYVSTKGQEVHYVTPDRGHHWACPAPIDWGQYVRGR